MMDSDLLNMLRDFAVAGIVFLLLLRTEKRYVEMIATLTEQHRRAVEIYVLQYTEERGRNHTLQTEIIGLLKDRLDKT